MRIHVLVKTTRKQVASTKQVIKTVYSPGGRVGRHRDGNWPEATKVFPFYVSGVLGHGHGGCGL